MRAPVLLFLFIALMLSDCAQTDPLTRAGTWNPVGVNDENLEVQVANPADLISGQGAQGSDGETAEAAVTRLRQGHVKTLLDDSPSTSTSSSLGSNSATTGSGGGT